MHRCLSCNQLCNISSIFCEACRTALLERSTETTEKEQAELVRAGNVEEGGRDLKSSSLLEAAPAGSQLDCKQELLSARTDEKHAWSFETSGIHTVEMMEEVVENMEKIDHSADATQATHLLAVPLAGRRRMPRGVRRALLIFCVVGVLALLTDGILLALSIARHYQIQATHQNQPDRPDIVPQSTPIIGSSPTPSAIRLHEADIFLLSSSRLAFTTTQGQTDMPSQTVTFSDGTQSTFSWLIVPETAFPSWLRLSATQGNATTGVTAAVMVSVQPAQLTPGTYTTTLLVKAFNNHGGALANSPEALMIVLNVRTPCILNVTPEKLSFAAVLVSDSSPQTLELAESTSCAFPVSWRVSADASWIAFSNTSGTDTSSGDSVTVQASSSGKLIGTYTAHITVLATDSSGAPVTVSPATITATLTVLG